MATTFTLLIDHPDAHYAQQFAEQAFDEVDRLERELSLFISDSDVAQFNALPANHALRIGPACMKCVQLACAVHADTHGAFDITIGHRQPDQPVGMKHLGVDTERHCLGKTIEGLRIDLGGIGKGFALDQLAGLAGDWSIDSALLSAGQSTVRAIGLASWPIDLRVEPPVAPVPAPQDICSSSLSGSADRDRTAHIANPRTGRPIAGRLGAWALAPSAAIADALSTAFFVMDAEAIHRYCQVHNQVAGLVIEEDSPRPRVLCFGSWPNRPSVGEAP